MLCDPKMSSKYCFLACLLALVILTSSAMADLGQPNYELMSEIVQQPSMPMAYPIKSRQGAQRQIIGANEQFCPGSDRCVLTCPVVPKQPCKLACY